MYNTATLNDAFYPGATGSFQRRLGNAALLSPEKELSLARKIRKAKKGSDEYIDLRNQFAEANLGLVVDNAKRLSAKTGIPVNDFIGAGNEGLMKAIDKFEPEKGFKFSTYATWWIKQSMSRALDNESRSVRIPVHMCERIRTVRYITSDLEQKLGRAPAISEIAEGAGLSEEQVLCAEKANQNVVSMHNRTHREDSEGGDYWIDALRVDDYQYGKDPLDEIEEQNQADYTKELLGALTEKEQKIISLRYGFGDGHEHTLAEIGKKFGVTHEAIRRTEQNAVKKMKRVTEGKTPEPPAANHHAKRIEMSRDEKARLLDYIDALDGKNKERNKEIIERYFGLNGYDAAPPREITLHVKPALSSIQRIMSNVIRECRILKANPDKVHTRPGAAPPSPA